MPTKERHGPSRLAHRLRLLLALAASLCSCGAARADPAGSPPPAPTSTAVTPNDNDGTAQTFAFTIPLTLVSGHDFFLLRLRLDGTTDATFVVDTGTNACLISQSLVQRLGLMPSPVLWQGKPVMKNGKQESTVTVDSIEFPGATVQGKLPKFNGVMVVFPDDALVMPPGLARPHDPATRFDGILGANLMGHFAAVFDSAARTLTLYYPGGLSARQARLVGCLGPGGASVTLERSSDHPDADRFYVPVSLTSSPLSRVMPLAVDTGADTTIIPRPLAHDLSLRKTGQLYQSGLERDFQADTAVVPSLGLGSLMFPNTQVVYPETGDYPPVLGMDILSRYRVLLDFPGKTMYLAPVSTPVAVPPPAPATSAVPPK